MAPVLVHRGRVASRLRVSIVDLSPNLSLPYIADAQAQKHVTHNEAIRTLDALVQLAVLDRDLAAPPASPANGDRYIVGPSPSGAWTSQADRVAAYQDGAWTFLAPREGFTAWIADEDIAAVWTGSAWVAAAGASVNPTPLVGVNATADTTNRLSVASPGTLFNHAGTDHRLVVNKATPAATGSVLFQTGFSGRAEFGLAGDDHWRVKVSPNGTSWRDALVVDSATGAVAFPFGGGVGANLLINGDFAINQRGFAGGTLAAGAFGHDRWKAAPGGASYTLAAGVVTLASGAIEQTIEPLLIAGATSLAATRLTVSVESPTADLTVTVGSATGTITAGAGRRAVTLTTAAGDTGNLTVRLARATAGSVLFALVKVEGGGTATTWTPRPAPQEVRLCQRYYTRFQNAGSTVHALSPAFVFTATRCFAILALPVAMRAVPTVTSSGAIVANFGWSNNAATAISIYGSCNNRELTLDITSTGMTTAGSGTATPVWYQFGLDGGAANFVAFSAEL